MDLTKLGPTNPLAYNPITLPIPVLGSLFGKGGDKNNTNAKLSAWSGSQLGPYAGGQVYAPLDGSTPLTSYTPQTGAGGSMAGAENKAFQDFQSIFGRNPSQTELTSLAQSYMSGDPNIINATAGQSAISNYYGQVASSPENVYSRQQQQYATDAPKYSDPVTQEFQTQLGRAPTQDELTYFGSLMASGQQGYQVGQALQQTQEYQNTQNTNFQNQLQKQLQDSNSTYFNQYIAPSIQSQSALSGQSPSSSALTAQLSQAALQQNQGLQNFLGGVTAQNYQNSTANASNQYNQLMGQQYGLQNANVSNALSNQQYNMQYNQNLSMYQMQQQAYSDYLNRYGKTGGLAGGLSGALKGGVQGATLGGKYGGPYGAILGGIGGAGLGGYSGAQL